MRIVDIYHINSRAMFYDLDSKKIIQGDAALALREKCIGVGRAGWLDFNEGVRADCFSNGHPTTIYGAIYEIC